jgi:FtsH-binding integral membrane protein
MTPISQSVSSPARTAESSWEQNWKLRNAEDGTNQLIRTGFWTLAFGIAATALAALVFSGFTQQGPHSSIGWLCIMFALMGLPFGITVSSLGLAKSLRNRHLARQGVQQPGTTVLRRR